LNLGSSKNKQDGRADKCNASADYSGGCATPKVEFWHPACLNKVCQIMAKIWSLNVSDAIYHHPRVGVAVLIQRDNKILLTRRSNSPEQNHWQCAGGYLRFGEDIYQCAQRCAQATGLQISQLSSGPCTNNIFTEQNLHTVTLYVLAGVCEGVERDGWQWFDCQHLPQPLFLPMQLLATQHKNWLSNAMNNVIS